MALLRSHSKGANNTPPDRRRRPSQGQNCRVDMADSLAAAGWTKRSGPSTVRSARRRPGTTEEDFHRGIHLSISGPHAP